MLGLVQFTAEVIKSECNVLLVGTWSKNIVEERLECAKQDAWKLNASKGKLESLHPSISCIYFRSGSASQTINRWLISLFAD